MQRSTCRRWQHGCCTRRRQQQRIKNVAPRSKQQQYKGDQFQKMFARALLASTSMFGCSRLGYDVKEGGKMWHVQVKRSLPAVW
jgi:hypothetical protein